MLQEAALLVHAGALLLIKCEHSLARLSRLQSLLDMSCSKSITAISFSKIAHGCYATVRVFDENLLYAVDLAMLGTGKNRNYAGQVLRNIPEDSFPSSKYVVRQLHAGHATKLLTFEDAITLFMLLPGKIALKLRVQLKDIIVRYLDGDRSMCMEIETNHAIGKVKSYSNFASKIMSSVDEEADEITHSMPQTSYVYATKSPAFPGLIKIGKTVDVASRLTSLNTSCAPAPHVIVAVAPSLDNERDEKAAHTFFSNARCEGEFFKLPDADVQNYFATHITAQYHAELAQNIARLQGRCV